VVANSCFVQESVGYYSEVTDSEGRKDMGNRSPRSFLKSIVLLCFMTTMLWATSNAHAEDSMTFRKIWPCSGNAAICSQRIFAEGIITSETPQRFIDFMAKAGFTYTPYMSFNSAGGDVRAAIALGLEIRERGIETFQEASYTEVLTQGQQATIENAVCASACVLAFIGGVNRIVERDALIGVHQFSGGGADLGESAAQALSVILARYIQAMGVSRVMLDVAALVPPTEMYWLTRQELVELRIDTTTRTSSSWKLQATNDGVLYTLSESPFSNTSANLSAATRIAFFKAGDEVVMAINVDFGLAPNDRVATALELLGERSVAITFDDRLRLDLNLVKWRKRGPQSFSSENLINQSVVEVFSKSNQFKVQFDFPNFLRDLDPSSTFYTGDLPNHLKAIIR